MSKAETVPGGHVSLSVEGIVKSYGGEGASPRAVDGVSFQIGEGEFYTLLGPSGCGKTTTLRCVAGLEHPDAGRILLSGAPVADAGRGEFLPPNERDIGMVFQSYAIWPHMSVFENIAFPLRVRRLGLSEHEIVAKVEAALEAVQLGGYGARPSTQLSGGQQQRLALARALVRRPRLLLLDEPLSNLDARLRDKMRTELKDLQRSLGITTLYVTHDQGEALTMSTRVAVMSAGRIIQEGTPREIYDKPASTFIAEFVGASNLIPATVVGRSKLGPEGLRLDTAIGGLDVTWPAEVESGRKVTLLVRPENVRLHRPGEHAGRSNTFDGVVLQHSFHGEHIEYRVRVGDLSFLSRQHPTFSANSGELVRIELTDTQCTVLAE